MVFRARLGRRRHDNEF